MDVVILHCDDSQQWSEYLSGQLSTPEVGLKISHLDYSQVLLNPKPSVTNIIKTACVKLLIISPDLFTFLCENTSCFFKDIICDHKRVVFFLCGAKPEDFGLYEVLDRFPYLEQITKFDHNNIADLFTLVVELTELEDEVEEDTTQPEDHTQPLTPTDAPVIIPRKPPKLTAPQARSKLPQKIHFELIPSAVDAEWIRPSYMQTRYLKQIHAEAFALIKQINLKNKALFFESKTLKKETEVVLSLKEPLSDKDVLRICLCNEVASLDTISLQFRRLNPYTYTFTAPAQMEGSKLIKLYVNEEVAGSCSILYQSSAGDLSDLIQIYIHCIELLCELCLGMGKLSTDDVDRKLTSLLDISTIPLVAFEKLFGIYEFALVEKSQAPLPTILHLAAKFGLEEFSSKLLDLPGVWDANDIANKDGKYPHDLAHLHSHNALSDLLQSSRDLRDIVSEDIYIEMVGKYYNAADPDDRGEPEMYTSTEYVPMYRKMSAPVVSPTIKEVWPKRRSKTLPEDVEDDYEDFDPESQRSMSADESIYGCIGSVRRWKTEANDDDDDDDDDDYLFMGGVPRRPKERMPDPFEIKAKHKQTCVGPGGNQQELIDIMNDVKAGLLNQNDAVMLYNDWSHRLLDGSKQCSFKEKQAHVEKLREDLKKLQYDFHITHPIPAERAAAPGVAKKPPKNKLSKAASSVQHTIPEDTVPPEVPEDLYLDLEMDPQIHARISTTSNGSRESSRSSRSSGFGDDDELLRSKAGDKSRRLQHADDRKSLRAEAMEAQLAKCLRQVPLDLPNPRSKPQPAAEALPRKGVTWKAPKAATLPRSGLQLNVGQQPKGPPEPPPRTDRQL